MALREHPSEVQPQPMSPGWISSHEIEVLIIGLSTAIILLFGLFQTGMT